MIKGDGKKIFRLLEKTKQKNKGPDMRISRANMKLIALIAKRAEGIIGKDVKSAGEPYDRGSCEMDLIATHKNGCPLDLEGLLTASDHDFGHDVFGINRFLNRETGELKSAFLPRYAKRRRA